MENDLISRSALVNAIGTEFDKLPIECDRLSILVALANVVKSAPAIDPKSLRERGRWEKSRYDGFLWCSVCKNCYVDDNWPNDKKWKFCPSCGERMDLEEP